MTLKEQRHAQIDTLKANGSTGQVNFCVEILNDSFLPRKKFVFETIVEAQAKYDALEPIYHAAFLRKFAVVHFE